MKELSLESETWAALWPLAARRLPRDYGMEDVVEALCYAYTLIRDLEEEAKDRPFAYVLAGQPVLVLRMEKGKLAFALPEPGEPGVGDPLITTPETDGPVRTRAGRLRRWRPGRRAPRGPRPS